MKDRKSTRFNSTLFLILTLFIALPAIAEEEDSQFIFPGKSDYPPLVRSASKPDGFIPRGWKQIGSAEGDLNGDKHLDYVLAVKGDFARFKQSHDFLGQNPFDTNPRLLLVILFFARL